MLNLFLRLRTLVTDKLPNISKPEYNIRMDRNGSDVAKVFKETMQYVLHFSKDVTAIREEILFEFWNRQEHFEQLYDSTLFGSHELLPLPYVKILQRSKSLYIRYFCLKNGVINFNLFVITERTFFKLITYIF